MYCICLVGQIGANENNRTKILFGVINLNIMWKEQLVDPRID